MTTAGTPPCGDDDTPDPPATQPSAVYDGENYFAPLLTARHGNGLPGGYADTLDPLHQVRVGPAPPPPTAKARRRLRIRETLPEVGIVTLVLVILGGLLASAVLMTATVAAYDHARHHGAAITKTAARPAPRPGAGVTPLSARPGLTLGSYLAPRMVPAVPSPSRMPVPASSLPGTTRTSPAASTAPPSSSPATPPATVTTTRPSSPPAPSASATPPPASAPASTPAPTTLLPTPTPTTIASPSSALTAA